MVAAASPDTPASGPLRIIGAAGNACIAGAVRLPGEGVGFETIRMNRSSFWGAPSTIAALERLATEAQEAGLPALYMGDISRPRGGPFGHFSHQRGLDADVYLDLTPKPPPDPAAREAADPASLVRSDGRGVDPAGWTPGHVTLLRLAAGLPGVDRIFVNPAIKRALCEGVGGDRRWLHLIRPWWGHAAHMHIRFRCPAGQPDCVQAAPPPAGEGCDATLDWWFAQLDQPPRPPAPPAIPPPLPAACKAVFEGP